MIMFAKFLKRLILSKAEKFVSILRNNLTEINFFLRNHFAAFLMAIFVGAVMVGPQLISIVSLGENYRGIPIQKADAELMYLSRMKEFSESNALRNPFIFEAKSEPNVPFSISEGLLTLPAGMLKNNIVLLNLIYKFIFPCGLFLIIYFFLINLFEDKKWAMTTGIFIILGYPLTEFEAVRAMFQWNFIFDQFLQYSRPVNPQLSSLVFFGVLFVLFKGLQTRRGVYFVVASCLVGISFYLYFYLFVFLSILLGVFLIIFLIKKDFYITRYLFGSLCGALTIGSYALFKYVEILMHPFYGELKNLVGILSERNIVLGSVQGAIYGVAIYFFKIRKICSDIKYIVIIALLLTTFIAINQHLITGMSVQYGHFHWYFNIPIYIIAGMFFVKECLSGLTRGGGYKNVFVTLVLLTSIFSGLFVQVSGYKNWHQKIVNQQRYATALNWLNENTLGETVVFAHDNLSELIPVYTSNNVVWQTMAFPFLMNSSRRNMTLERILQVKQKSDLSGVRIDYVVWDIIENPGWGVRSWDFIEEVFSGDGFVIYKMI